MSTLAIYVFLKDGRCAFSQTYSPDAPSPDFFGPLFAALDSFAKATVGQEIQNLEMGTKIRVHVGDFGLYYVLLATDPDSKLRADRISETIDQIGFKFWEMYFQDIGEWDGNVVRFSGFDQICRNIVNPGQERVLPTRILDAISIIGLEKALQKTALALLDRDGEASISEISMITKRSDEEESGFLEQLVLMGYVGRLMKGTRLFYFVDKYGED
ncbi:MAG: hypothetical protein ACFFB3_15945 [Candidatus Hodarchaeota archaeon]